MPDQQNSTIKSSHQVPENKQTTLGHYVTAEEAYAMWKNEPKKVHILDVRTPVLYVKHEWNPETRQFVIELNPDFIAEAKRQFKSTDTILVMCRSGDRSAMAVNALAKAGFVKVYNIIDGMEGDLMDDPKSKNHGKRMKNGWKNSGSPWTYDVNPEQTCLPCVRK